MLRRTLWRQSKAVLVWQIKTYAGHFLLGHNIWCMILSRPQLLKSKVAETTDGASESFELVVFSSYEVKERAPYLGETRLTIGEEPIWKTLDRESVEALVEQKV